MANENYNRLTEAGNNRLTESGGERLLELQPTAKLITVRGRIQQSEVVNLLARGRIEGLGEGLLQARGRIARTEEGQALVRGDILVAGQTKRAQWRARIKLTDLTKSILVKARTQVTINELLQARAEIIGEGYLMPEIVSTLSNVPTIVGIENDIPTAREVSKEKPTIVKIRSDIKR